MKFLNIDVWGIRLLVKCFLFCCLFHFSSFSLSAQQITSFNLSGPYAVYAPYATDTVDINGKKFEDKTLLNSISLDAPVSTIFKGDILPSLNESRSVGLLTFYINSNI